jgi:hypothetical protein
MKLSQAEIRKNRIIAIAVTLVAFSFLLLTFFLKKILAVPAQDENAGVFAVSPDKRVIVQKRSAEENHCHYFCFN